MDVLLQLARATVLSSAKEQTNQPTSSRINQRLGDIFIHIILMNKSCTVSSMRCSMNNKKVISLRFFWIFTTAEKEVENKSYKVFSWSFMILQTAVNTGCCLSCPRLSTLHS